MHPLFERRLRPIATVILVFFSWFCIEPWNFAVAAQTPAPPAKVSSREKGPSEKLEETLHKIKSLTQALDQDLAADQEIQPRIDQLAEQQKNVAALDAAVLDEFTETEAFLKAKHLPAEILDRHAKALAEYQQNIQTLRKNLDDTVRIHGERKRAKGRGDLKGADQKKGELRAKLKAAKSHLEEKVKERPHQKLDPNNLPHRMPKVKERAPRLKKEEFTEFQKPIQLAFNGDPSTLMLVQSTQDLPTPADLAETIEVQFTPEIQDLAAQLEHHPVKIYNWVHNNIDYVPTYGSIQGAQMCLMTKQCNDIDTASLLIALLRTSGISARYVYGTIVLPIDKAMNWVGGFTDAKSAVTFITSGGVPAAGGISGGKITEVRLEHVWVEAYADYIPSRGAVHKQGDTWVPLDASFKQHLFTPGVKLQTAVSFDGPAFLDQVQATATIDPNTPSVTGVDAAYVQASLTDYQNQIQSYLTANHPNATVGDVLGTRTIKEGKSNILQLTLPYKTLVTAGRYSQVPDTLRHKITFELSTDAFFGPDFSYTASLPALAGKRITLSYDPATSSDQDLINQYIDQLATSIPAYLVHLQPKLKINGEVVSSGPSIGMGLTQTLTLTFTSPSIGQDMVSHLILAGDYSAVGLNLGQVTADLLQKRIDLNDFSEPVGEMLHQTLLSYWGELDAFNKIISSQSHVAVIRHPSEGLAAAKVTPTYLFGVPNKASYKSRTLDIARDLQTVIHQRGDGEKIFSYFTQAGIYSSALEGLIFDQLFGRNLGDGISAVRILELANGRGVPIYLVNASNIGGILPLLEISNEVKSNIQNAVGAGKVIQIPKREITHGGWRGVGYVVQDPTSGAGAYLISGGLLGGSDETAETVFPLPEIPASPVVVYLLIGILATLATAAGAPTLIIAGGVIVGIFLTPSIAEATTATYPNTQGGSLNQGAIIAIILAIIKGISDSISRTRPPEDWIVLRHYTKPESLLKIFTPVFGLLQAGVGESRGIFLTELKLHPAGFRPDGTPNYVYIATALQLFDKLGNIEVERGQAFIELRINRAEFPPGSFSILKPCALQEVQPCNEWLYPFSTLEINSSRVKRIDSFPY
ncbi:transglutaminase-like domain-containing protein [Candidatus Manganitrophus noduliformans]|uniref:Transglutaminase n=1 Tax=Candidatus Manganitrophus noduliformans TaxID=2606439 RepID=A0A7X6DTY8_9BACT|nr:transglutaminase-like domain-containing protein [Candidatus Manganitrophus noduliformans]NKE73370.1 transglutaminase [Candidatus Manganitrophus noduliformans]